MMKKVSIFEDGMSSFMVKFKKYLYNHCIVYFKEYPMLFYFIITALFNTLLLRIITVGNLFYLKPFLADLGMLFLLSSFMFLFKGEKSRKKYLVVLSFIVMIVCLINSIYYSYYDSYASVSLLATSTFLGDVGDAVIEKILRFSDLVYLWQPLFLLSYYIRDKKKNGLKSDVNKEKTFKNTLIKRGKRAFADILVCGFCILAFTCMFFTKTEWGRFGKLWNRESVVSSFGILTYQINDICQSLEPKINNLFGHDSALKEVTGFYDNLDVEKGANDYSGLFKGKNVIVIHAESLQTIALESSFNDVLVAPTFSRLANDGIYFSNFYSQVGVGTSSDAEFTFSTSLMPSSNGTVFVNYFDREYNTIQKAFKEAGYYTFSMHGNTGDFWNRATMHKNMGYDKFYSKSSFEIDETIGLGLSDKSFFKQAVSIIEDVSQKYDGPFYTTAITLTNHTPWSDLELIDEYDTSWTVEIDGEEVVRDYIDGTTLGDYFRNVHYMDQALEQFINDLDAAGLLENTVLVIYGDHDARISKKNYNLLYNYNPYTDEIRSDKDIEYIDYNEYEYKLDKNVPFIIWSKNNNVNKEITTATGMIDAYPILANLFGLELNQFQLGNDVLGNGSEDNMVVFTDGSYLTNKIYYNGQNGEIYSIDGSVVSEEYIRNNALHADEIIGVSNDIITYDLIKEIKEKSVK